MPTGCTGCKIDFAAATADTVAGLPAAPPAGPPTTAVVGTATTTTPTGYDCTGCPTTPKTVDSQLVADTGTASKANLRIFMTFTPSGSLAPALTNWYQLYDCTPAE
jgi:hypothetical protein